MSIMDPRLPGSDPGLKARSAPDLAAPWSAVELPVNEKAPQFAPHDQPGGSFMDRLAVTLANVPMPQPSSNGQAAFLAALLAGLAHGFSATRLKSMAQRQETQTGLNQVAARQNERNWKMAENAMTERRAFLRSLQKAKTPEQIAAEAEAATSGKLTAERKAGAGVFAPKPAKELSPEFLATHESFRTPEGGAVQLLRGSTEWQAAKDAQRRERTGPFVVNPSAPFTPGMKPSKASATPKAATRLDYEPGDRRAIASATAALATARRTYEDAQIQPATANLIATQKRAILSLAAKYPGRLSEIEKFIPVGHPLENDPEIGKLLAPLYQKAPGANPR